MHTAFHYISRKMIKRSFDQKIVKFDLPSDHQIGWQFRDQAEEGNNTV